MGRLALLASRGALAGCVFRMKERVAGLVILCKGAGAAERGLMAVTLAGRAGFFPSGALVTALVIRWRAAATVCALDAGLVILCRACRLAARASVGALVILCVMKGRGYVLVA